MANALTDIFVAQLQGAMDRVGIPRALKLLKDEVEARMAVNEVAHVASIRLDLTAGTDLAEAVLQREPLAGTITAVEFEGDATVAGHDTDNVTFTVRQRNGAGGAAATVATLQTTVAAGGWTAFVSKSLGAITNATIVAASKVTIQVGHAGAGQAVHGVLRVKYTS